MESLGNKGMRETSIPDRNRKQGGIIKTKLCRFKRVTYFPDRYESSIVYVMGESGHLWAAAMLCPCGCGDVIELNLAKNIRPCWRVIKHVDGLVTISPSVRRTIGCRSHFFVRHGKIDWYFPFDG